MRIALYHNAPSGGAKRAIYEWAARLAGKHTLDVYTLSTANQDYCDIRPLAHAHHVYPFTPRRLFHRPWGRLNQLQHWRDLADLDRLSRSIAADLDTGHYDVLFAHTCLLAVIPGVLQYTQVPSVYYLHEPIGVGAARYIPRPYTQTSAWRNALDRMDPFISGYRRRLATDQERSLRATRLFLANSRFTCESMPEATQHRTEFCRLGVNLSQFQPMSGVQQEHCVVSVGELSPRKGFDFIIESLGRIPAEVRPTLKLACNRVEPQERAFIESLAQRHGVRLQVFTEQSAEALRRLYNTARMCVYAPYQEPFGLVPLEAMACGRPIVGVREGGVAESVVPDVTGLLVDRDAAQFGQAVGRLLCDEGLAARLGQNGREHVAQHWTWEQSTQTLEGFLQRLAQAKRHP
ncbi:MAG TPA: glycosyltransferase family 4 protein [Aggregatilineales bacterium]|nr:glycosyltransferase family 4 protein [Aggregatilineales bacterium]